MSLWSTGRRQRRSTRQRTATCHLRWVSTPRSLSAATFLRWRKCRAGKTLPSLRSTSAPFEGLRQVFREIAPSTRLAWFRRCGSGHHDDGLKGHQQPDLADSCDGLAISSSHKAGLADLQPEVSGPVRGQIAARGEKIWEGVRGGRRSVAPLSNLPPPGVENSPPSIAKLDESGPLRSVVVGPLCGS